MKLGYIAAPLSSIGPLVLWLGSAAFAANADSAPPDREMLRMIDLLRDMEMIKRIDLLQDMPNLAEGAVSTKTAPERKSTPAKQKESAK